MNNEQRKEIEGKTQPTFESEEISNSRNEDATGGRGAESSVRTDDGVPRDVEAASEVRGGERNITPAAKNTDAVKDAEEKAAPEENSENGSDDKNSNGSSEGEENENSPQDTEGEHLIKNEKLRHALKVAGKCFSVGFNVLLVAILLINVYIMIARKVTGQENPRVFGIASAVVLTDSMNGDLEDSFSGNDMIFTVKKKEYNVGDIIMFNTQGTTVTHRIIGIEAEGYVTKGDANNAEDTDRVKYENVVGKVFLVIPKVGVVLRVMTTPLGMMLLAIVCFGAIGLPYFLGSEEEEESV